MKIEEAVEKFCRQCDADGRSVHTVGQYRRHGRVLATWAAVKLGTTDLAAIGPEELAAFLVSDQARLRPDARPKTAGSVNSLRTSLKVLFGYAVRAGFVGADPSRLIRRARCGAPPPRALSAAEQKRLREVLREAEGLAAERDATLVELMLSTGLRLAEAVGTDVEDLDLEDGVLWITRAKGGADERVFLGEAIRERLRRFVGDRDSGPLFVGTGGRRISRRQVQRRFGALFQRARIGRRASPHSLRHSFAMQLYESSGDILVVQAALRHRTVASTLVYARADVVRVREQVGAMFAKQAFQFPPRSSR